MGIFRGLIQQGGVILVEIFQVVIFLIPLRRLNSLMQGKPELLFIFYNVILPEIQDRRKNFHMEHTLKRKVQNEAPN